MAHHAYLLTGSLEEGITRAHAFVEEVLGLSVSGNPDVTTLRYDFLSVEDARLLITIASQAPVAGGRRALIVSASRLYHEAQNALLKVFEEPSESTTLFLIVPSEAVLLPTLRSRVISLEDNSVTPLHPFLLLSPEERSTYMNKLLDRTKADKDETKQAARREALELVQSILSNSYQLPSGRERTQLLSDLLSFIESLHARSAPLKLIFEHLLLVLPGASAFPKAKV